MLEQLFVIIRGFLHRFPQEDNPFQIMTRLLEEGGELAQQVNHFEGAGVKREKMGEPDRKALAAEIAHVVHCALHVAVYYGVEQEMEAVLETAYQRLKAEGHIEEEEMC